MDLYGISWKLAPVNAPEHTRKDSTSGTAEAAGV